MFHVKQASATRIRLRAYAQEPILRPSRPSAAANPRDYPINAISALLAFITGVVHAGLAPVLATGDVRPNLILAAVVAATALFGLGTGAIWAFVGGLTANLLTTDPLGTLPLSLLLIAGLVAGGRRVVFRTRPIVPLIGGLIGSLIVNLVLLATIFASGSQPPELRIESLAGLLLPTAALNAGLATVLWFAARAVAVRLGYEPSAA